jgi:tetratricopeptide (TPR) repeat protein
VGGGMPASKIAEYVDELRSSRPEGPPSEFRLRRIVKDLESAIPKFHGADRRALLGTASIACHHLGQFDKSLAHFNQIRAMFPDDKDNYNNIAWAQMALGRYTDAFDALTKADVTEPQTLLGFATVLSYMGNLDDARKAFEDAVVARTDPRFMFEYHFWCAIAAARLGSHVEACELFARALSHYMNQPLGDIRAIDFINNAPDSAKGSLGYRDAQGLVKSIQELTEHGDALLKLHNTLSSLPQYHEPDSDYYERAHDIYVAMAPFRERALASVVEADDGPV